MPDAHGREKVEECAERELDVLVRLEKVENAQPFAQYRSGMVCEKCLESAFG